MTQAARIEALAAAFAVPVEGPSYRLLTRVMAGTVALGSLAWGVRLLLAHADELSSKHWTAAAIVALAMLWPLPMLFGRTVLDARGIRQTGWMGKEVTWPQAYRARFLRLPTAPRLLVSTGFGRARVFYSGSKTLDEAFERVAGLLNDTRDAP